MLVPIAETRVLRAKITPHPWAVALSMAAPMAANRLLSTLAAGSVG